MERWLLLIGVLGIHLFVSVKNSLFLINPPQLRCGLPFVGIIILQTALAFLAMVAVSLKFYFSCGYSWQIKLVVYLLILLPLLGIFLLF